MSIDISMSKIHTNLSIESSLMQSAKDKGINVSAICEDALKEILMTYEHNTDPSICEHKWTWPFSVPSGLAKECLRCGLIKKVFIETTEEQNERYRRNHIEAQLDSARP